VRLQPQGRLAIQLVHGKIAEASLSITKVWEDCQTLKEERENPAAGNIEPKAYQDAVAEWKKRK
jgi:hypothetical protein